MAEHHARHHVRYTRQFKRGDSGPDVEGVGRALARSHTKGNTKITRFQLMPQRVRRRWGTRKQKDLRRFKKKHHLHADSLYTKHAHEVLSPFFDAKARKLMSAWEKPVPVTERHWENMLEAMQAVTAAAPGYSYGGEHDSSIADDLPTSWFDCSSSCSYALKKGGMFPHTHSIVSGDFRYWGEPGPGRLFTVYCNDGHVWIRLHKSRWWRFDTSAYGDRKSWSGPRLRYLPRPTWGFTARHWPGM